ncbi:lipid IV(A) 4-amino-4-deoxy-L-arabinosyltransferase [Paraferrimonas sp. SM1919]|uniref:lipid IV(A) 4-amino-4-deoxy-L-arabinosyltransferase n=1 Tax=Paraferrimonas sp. SM1919 TaxID=2662263 RepID=UPI0013CFA3AF|nr:lipid IV(A) 4-amino-4-deoxy-L-arabinosyltransferase [Paraferrimonas sp. SM1919]
MIRRLAWLLPLAFVLLYLIPLGQRPLWEPDESRYAEISREMLQADSWAVPKFLALDYFEKPVLGYWLNSMSMAVFGENAFAVRFMSAIAAAASAFIIYLLSLHILQNRAAALASAAVYLSFFIVFMIGTYSTLDSMLSFWLSAAFACFYWAVQAQASKDKFIRYGLFGALCGAAFMTKGFVALALPVVAIVPFMVLTRRFQELIGYGLYIVVVATIVALPWSISVHFQADDYWNYFFWEEHIRRFSSDNAQHKEPFWFYIPWLLVGAMPWGLAFFSVLKTKIWSQNKDFYWYLFLWFLMPILLLSYAKGKLPTYILPCFAPLAIYLGNGIVKLIADKQWHKFKLIAWSNIVFAGSLLVALILAMLGVIGDGPLYQLAEMPKIICALIIFMSWLALGVSLLLQPEHGAFAKITLMPVALMLLLPFSGPNLILDSKAPEGFLQRVAPIFEQNTHFIADDVGLAGSIAFEYQRSDITLWGSKGEVAYGLEMNPDKQRYIPWAQASERILQLQQQQSVAVMMRRQSVPAQGELPEADKIVRQGRFILYFYKRAN